jgi:hypothetical protein
MNVVRALYCTQLHDVHPAAWLAEKATTKLLRANSNSLCPHLTCCADRTCPGCCCCCCCCGCRRRCGDTNCNPHWCCVTCCEVLPLTHQAASSCLLEHHLDHVPVSDLLQGQGPAKHQQQPWVLKEGTGASKGRATSAAGFAALYMHCVPYTGETAPPQSQDMQDTAGTC